MTKHVLMSLLILVGECGSYAAEKFIIVPEISIDLLPTEPSVTQQTYVTILGQDITNDIGTRNVPVGPWDASPEVVRLTKELQKQRYAAYQLAEKSGAAKDAEAVIAKQQQIDEQTLGWTEHFLRSLSDRKQMKRYTQFGIYLSDFSSTHYSNDLGVQLEMVSLVMDGVEYNPSGGEIILSPTDIQEADKKHWPVRVLLLRSKNPATEVPYLTKEWDSYGHVYLRLEK
jgi:hypothetical protein